MFSGANGRTTSCHFDVRGNAKRIVVVMTTSPESLQIRLDFDRVKRWETPPGGLRQSPVARNVAPFHVGRRFTFWADIGGPKTCLLSFVFGPAGHKNMKLPCTSLIFGLRGCF